MKYVLRDMVTELIFKFLCSDSGSGINRVLTYYDLNGGWTGETNITGSMTDSFWFKPGYRKIRIVVFDNAGNSSETVISVQCG